MSEHPRNLLVEKEIPAEMAAPGVLALSTTGRELSVLASGLPRPADGPRAPVSETKPRRLRQLLLVAVSVLTLSGAGHFGWEYWTVGRFHVSTDDAYVKADNTTIAPKVSGYLSAVLVDDNEQVKAGQALARIDDRDYRVALDQSKADLDAANAAFATKQAQLTAQQSAIDAARATIAVDQANLTFAEQEDKRYSQLAATGYGSIQNAQQAASRIATARAAVARDAASLENATRQLDVLKAELNLSYTAIASPIDGVVGNRTLRVGQYVQAGTQLMAVVPATAAYIIANYKETQLTDVRPGQPASIAIDMFPNVTFSGHVDSIAPASGQEFALLPPDNATGNFTKVVQRIPVKIVLDPGSEFADELRPGMSVYPTIDTKSQVLRAASRAVHRG